MKKDKKKTSEHSSKDTSRHKGRRSRQTSQSENRGEASALDHGDTTKPMGKRDGHVPKQQAAPSKKPSSSPAGGATSSVSTTKTRITDKKVAGHSHKNSSESAAQPASGWIVGSVASFVFVNVVVGEEAAVDADIFSSGAASLNDGHIYGNFIDFETQPTHFVAGRN